MADSRAIAIAPRHNSLRMVGPDGTKASINIDILKQTVADPDCWFAMALMLIGGPPAPVITQLPGQDPKPATVAKASNISPGYSS